MTVQIYVSLPDEAVITWRPVWAEALADGSYLIIDQPYDREDERWEFVPGDRVICQTTRAYEGPILAAVSRAD